MIDYEYNTAVRGWEIFNACTGRTITIVKFADAVRLAGVLAFEDALADSRENVYAQSVVNYRANVHRYDVEMFGEFA